MQDSPLMWLKSSHKQPNTYFEEIDRIFLELRREAAEKSQRQIEAVSRLITEVFPET